MFFTPKRRPTAHSLLGQRGRDARARREYAATLYVTGAVQAALAVSLVVAGLVAHRAVQAHAPDVQATLGLALPALFVVGAAATARSAVRNLRLARREREGANENDPPAP